ncbi:MAG: sugar ABC transporter permease [Meiothermus sp.]|nr:sugar ABC transporter permease [Meiothermus sp.]
MRKMDSSSVPRRQNGLAARKARTAWLYLLPTILILILVTGYPLVRTIYLSFFEAGLRFPLNLEFVGFDNYRNLIADPIWWRSVVNTLVFTVSSVALETILGLMIALLVHTNFKGRGLVRTAMLVPWAIPGVVAAQLWRWMLNDVYGVINDLLLKFQLISRPYAWLAEGMLIMVAVILADVWKTTPFMALILLAGLQAIPKELYEAARVDGATPAQQFWRITLPLLRPVLLVALIFRSLDALRVFDMIYVMAGTQVKTISMSVYGRQQLMEFADLGYGSAVSTAIFLVIAIYTVIYIATLKVEVR